MPNDLFHPLIRQWFAGRFDAPTEPQQRGWPHIAADRHVLIAAPTGSGKTLAAFLVCLDRLFRQWLDGRLEDEIQVVYVSPLKALSNDIERNLRQPLAEIQELACRAGMGSPPIRVAVRTGDTPAGDRQKMLRKPPHILVTTPESLYLLLTSEKGRERLRNVRTVIVDEIHALARDKRGSHLSLTLERLTSLCEHPPTRVGLSATQRPIDKIASFLVGNRPGEKGENGVRNQLCEAPAGPFRQLVPDPVFAPPCEIVDAGHVRSLDLAVEVPPSPLSAVCSHEQWTEVYQRLTGLVQQHRSTLIFVNTRRLAERVAHHLRELLGEESVAAHHGSLSREIRLNVERRLKAGELQAIVATASLEMGIDIGYIDLVCQIGSPRSIAAFLQRVGRSGHCLGAIPRGRLFPLTRDELLECLALVRAVRRGDLDQIEIPEKPLDILAQQIIAETACQPQSEKQLLELCQRAWPYRHLTPDEFETIVEMVSRGAVPGSRRGAYLHRDRINGRLRARRGARLAAITSGGAIPEKAEYRVVTERDKTFVGTLDEDFAIESMAGDIFLLGNTSWRIRHVRGGEVVVNDAAGAPPTIPFWFGEGPGRTVELSHEVSRLREDLNGGELSPAAREKGVRNQLCEAPAGPLRQLVPDPFFALREQCGADEWAAEQAHDYVAAQQSALGLVPTKDEIVFERFFDESGGMQLVIHAPLGARINRAWGLALRKRFCRSFDFELQAAATDDGIVLSLGPQHSVPIENLFKIVRPDNGKYLLEQALLAAPMFQVRWRWNVTRALAVLRREGGRKVPPHLQRFRSDDLLASAFPETVGCLENHHGDVPIPSHPLVQQTMFDCLHEAMDLDRWLELLEDVQSGRVKLIARDTREPSPFCHELLNANPYAFLDDAPLEERRTRAVTTRRSLTSEAFQDLARLDPQAIQEVRRQAWPLVRDADELHDALLSLVLVAENEADAWSDWLGPLVADGRATRLRISASSDNGCVSGERVYWTAAEHWPLIQAVYDRVEAEPVPELPASLQTSCERSRGWVELVRGRMQHSEPLTAEQVAARLHLDAGHVHSALEALEAEGVVLRGRFSDGARASSASGNDAASQQWCDRRLLARIHRLTLDGLRRQIEPAEPADYMRFLVRYHHLEADRSWGGPVGVREAIGQLQGFQLPAGAWEEGVLRARIADYDPAWLDQLFLSGELMWGRLRPPRPKRDQQNSMAALTRTVPISLLLRQDLAWLLPDAGHDEGQNERDSVEALARSNAREVLASLTSHGALFFQELKLRTNLLPAHLEEALRELAALGLATSDVFAAVRTIVAGNRGRPGRRRQRPTKMHGPSSPVGRWSRFPGLVEATEQELCLENWCRQLLRRYGVVFREVLWRESAAPPWFDLVRTFRRLELRGEIRGGRFVQGVAGEQFAGEEAVGQLRAMRDAEPTGEWVVVSAADPVNLVGIVTEHARIPATHKNWFILQDGRPVAAMLAGEVIFFEQVETSRQAEMRRALCRGRRPAQADTMSPPLPTGLGTLIEQPEPRCPSDGRAS